MPFVHSKDSYRTRVRLKDTAIYLQNGFFQYHLARRRMAEYHARDSRRPPRRAGPSEAGIKMDIIAACILWGCYLSRLVPHAGWRPSLSTSFVPCVSLSSKGGPPFYLLSGCCLWGKHYLCVSCRQRCFVRDVSCLGWKFSLCLAEEKLIYLRVPYL